MDTELDTFKRVQEGHTLARRRGAQPRVELLGTDVDVVTLALVAPSRNCLILQVMQAIG